MIIKNTTGNWYRCCQSIVSTSVVIRFSSKTRRRGLPWLNPSDARLKDIIGPFERGLQDLETLNPIYYKYKKNNVLDLPSKKEYVGIIAQDAQKAVPESVQVDKKGFLHFTNDAVIKRLHRIEKHFQ